MLTSQERKSVESALARVLSVRGNPQAFLQTVFRAEAGPILLTLPQMGTPREYASQVVSECLVSRWSRDPALLDLLLDYLVSTGGIGELMVVLLRVREKIDPNPSIYDCNWVIGDRPFFDRKTLRARVRRVLEDNGRPILRVTTGPDTFGKSYTRYFLEHLESDPGTAVHVVPVELSRGTGPSYTVEDLLDEISSQLARTDPLPLRTTSSYAAPAARWILKQLGRCLPGRTFLVLDGFGDPDLHPEVRQTIERVAALVPSGQHRSRIRLVLVDYPQELPGISPADFVDEALRPASTVDSGDLLPCLTDWNRKRVEQGLDELSDDELAEVANEMLATVPVTGKQRLQALNAKLFALQGLD